MRFAAGILGGLRSGKTTAPRPNEAAQFGAGAAFAGACADQITLHVRQPAKHGNHEPAGAGRGVRPSSARLRNCPPASMISVTKREKLGHGSRQLRPGARDVIFTSRHPGPGL